MYCSKCGKDNEENALFCVSCGTRYRVDCKCPMCNTDVKKDENFCPSCGYNVGGVNVNDNSIYTKIMIIMNFCFIPLIIFLSIFNIYNIDGFYSRTLATIIGAGIYFLMIVIFIFIIGFGIYCLIAKSKVIEIIHDCLSVFMGLFLTFYLLYVSMSISLSVMGITLFLIVLAYTIASATFTIIKLCKKMYSLEV